MHTKLLRLGFTESTLLLIYYYRQQNKCNNSMIALEHNLIKWLYTTSGYYDKTITSEYMDACHSNIIPQVYSNYMNRLLSFIKNSDVLSLVFHKTFDNSNELIEEFSKYMNTTLFIDINKQMVYNFINSKKILIVSPFAVLIKSQIVNGNCKKIYDNFPSVESVSVYTFPYTFFNKGPDKNILETSEKHFNNILKTVKNDYDSVLISCGAYSCILAEQFYNINKNVCTVGGQMQTFFGILNSRYAEQQKSLKLEIENLEYWITDIPEEYKPTDYKKIENGCYW
jgi:hypothetical protein